MSAFSYRRFAYGVTSTAIIALALPGVVMAQTTPQPAPTDQSAEDTSHLQDIIVTATRRSERLQNVPISAEVVGSLAIKKQNINNLQTLSQIDPSVRVNDQRRAFSIYIRGIGSGATPSFDSSVPIFIDDIYHGRTKTAATTFLDVDRIEILKGPQSTYFGNNSVGGAFSIASKKPTDQLEGDFRALYGMFGQYAVDAAVGGPLSDTLGVRLAATTSGQNGWVDNILSNTKAPRQRNYAVRGTVVYKPTSDLDVTIKAEGGHSTDDGGAFLNLTGCPPPAPFTVTANSVCAKALAAKTPTGNDSRIISQSPSSFWIDSFDTAMTINYHIGEHTLTSVSGYSWYNTDIASDLDGTAANILAVALPENYRQFSQEIRLTSPIGKPIEYVVGGYFQIDRLAVNSLATNALLPTPGVLATQGPIGQEFDFNQHEHTFAGFFAVTWNITDKLKLIGGMRETTVHKDYTRPYFLIGSRGGQFAQFYQLSAADQAYAFANVAPLKSGTPGTASGSRDDTAALPSAKIQYQFTPAVMSYASFSRGFLAGGFNSADTTGVASNIPFAPEYINSYELGMKGQFFDHKLQLNLAAFNSVVSDAQVTINTPAGLSIVSVVRNAAKEISRGVEFEGHAIFNRHFNLQANITYLDSFYSSYKNVPATSLQAAQHGAAYLQDLSGKPTPFAAKWSGTITPTVTFDVGHDLRLVTQASGIFSSGYYFPSVDDPLSRQTPYMRVDGQITLESPGHRWAVDIVGKNLTDKTILVFDNAIPGSLGTFVTQKQAPRNVSIQFRYHF